MSERKDIPSLRGARFEAPKNPGTFIGKKWRAMIVAVMNIVTNLRIFCPVTSNGVTTYLEADIKMSPLGGIVTLPDILFASGDGTAQIVYVKACLADGTECYVPIKVYGTIYRLPGSSVTTPTIDAGAVPDGSKELT